jgi:hypothetical protein
MYTPLVSSCRSKWKIAEMVSSLVWALVLRSGKSSRDRASLTAGLVWGLPPQQIDCRVGVPIIPDRKAGLGWKNGEDD